MNTEATAGLPPSSQRTRLGEFVVLFLLLPALFYLDIYRFPKIPSLLIVTLYCAYVHRKQMRRRPAGDFETPPRRCFLRVFPLRLLLVTAVLVLFTGIFHPERLFSFPRRRFDIWLMVIILYPFLSALPQELIYRAFFFHRYRFLFPTDRRMIFASALTFAYLHIIFDNLFALIATFIGGLLFATTYRNTRSLLLTSLEHAVYGNIVFTLGLGRFFYEGF